jgi:hypothetical protein
MWMWPVASLNQMPTSNLAVFSASLLDMPHPQPLP